MMFRKLYNQLKFEVVLGVRCYCPDHGINESFPINYCHIFTKPIIPSFQYSSNPIGAKPPKLLEKRRM